MDRDALSIFEDGAGSLGTYTLFTYHSKAGTKSDFAHNWNGGTAMTANFGATSYTLSP
jgi:hypothetical protein